MNTTITTKSAVKILFPLGKCYMTPGISELIEQHQLPVAEYLMRHQTGDWSELSQEDQDENALSVEQDYRILSAYTFAPNNDVCIKIWIITEAGHKANPQATITTVLLPSEY